MADRSYFFLKARGTFGLNGRSATTNVSSSHILSSYELFFCMLKKFPSVSVRAQVGHSAGSILKLQIIDSSS